MLSIIVLDTMHDEEPNISDILEEAYSKRDLPVKRLAVFREPAPLFGFAEEQSDRFNVFIASFSWLRDEYMELAQNLRRRRKNLFIVFVVGRNVDISCCVRPSVRPSGILFIPLEKQRIYQTLSEIYVELLRSAERGNSLCSPSGAAANTTPSILKIYSSLRRRAKKSLPKHAARRSLFIRTSKLCWSSFPNGL